MFTVYFNIQNSFYDLGLKIPHRPNIPVPEKNIKTYDIEGRDGSLTEKLGYKDIEIPVSFNFVDNTNYNDTCRKIKAWLNGDIFDNKLIFSDDISCFYKVKYVRMSNNIERALKFLGRFATTFVCEPFCYLEEGSHIITLTKPESIYNQGSYKSDPIITIYGTGNITLSINNNITNLTAVEDYITIDSVFKDCYKGTQLCNNKMSGNFITLLQGENVIGWQGNVTKIEVIPNWRSF